MFELRPSFHLGELPYLLVMPVIFQDISTSRCGGLSMELEASRCLCLIVSDPIARDVR
jgi:hypothetical protein